VIVVRRRHCWSAGHKDQTSVFAWELSQH